MRMTVLGIGLGLLALLVLAIGSGPQQSLFAQNQRPGTLPAAPGDGLITFTSSISDKVQMLTVVDPRQHVVSVYHIDTRSGEIALKGVRNIHWDLQMSEFNGVSPLPREIRSLAEPH